MKKWDCFVENCLGNLTAKGLLKSATISRNYDKPSSVLFLFPCFFVSSPSVLWRCWLGGRKGTRPVKTESWGAGVVICLERGADLHMAQLTPLPLTVSCFSEIQIGFAFLVLADPGSPGKKAVKRACVCVRACVHACVCVWNYLKNKTQRQFAHTLDKKTTASNQVCHERWSNSFREIICDAEFLIASIISCTILR